MQDGMPERSREDGGIALAAPAGAQQRVWTGGWGGAFQYRHGAAGRIDTVGGQHQARRVRIAHADRNRRGIGIIGHLAAKPACGYQVILPGEIAPAHRHVASALRFILEGKDAYTAVAGERTMMEPGDFVITPSWTWHDHGNESENPMVWIDGLDMHMVNLFSASFREGYPGRTHPVVRPEGSAMAEAGFNLLPVDFEATSQTSPIFNYPYRRTREALDRAERTRDPDVCHGYKMQYINPVNGKSAIPTITATMQLLPKGFVSQTYRSTAGTVFSVVEGRGAVRVGDQRFVLSPRDLFVVPSWFPMQIEAEEELI